MAKFSFRVSTRLQPQQAWAAVLDFRRHTAVVPLTRVVAPAQPRAGDEICARTAVGPFGVDDVMRIEAWGPPRLAVLRKTGKVLGGTVRVVVQETLNGSDVLWRQTVELPWLPKKLGDTVTAVAAPIIRYGYRLTVHKLLTSSIHPG